MAMAPLLHLLRLFFCMAMLVGVGLGVMLSQPAGRALYTLEQQVLP
jgi:hypothetical protein